VAWQDRLRDAAYTSPSGTRHRFYFESVSRETSKRTAAFEFPGVNESYVQDNGHGGRRYALRCIFWGDDHDIESTRFEAGLLERGIGRLEHPLYGVFDVVPFGDITRRDDVRSAANQTVVEVTFMTTVGAVYPEIQSDPRSEVLAALAGFDQALAEEFADAADLTTTAARANVQARYRDFLGDVSAELSGVAAETESVRRTFADVQREVNLGLDVLIGQPLQLVQQVSGLIRAPARADAGIASRLRAYAALATKIITSPPAIPGSAFVGGIVLASRRRKVANDFHTSVVFAANAVAGGVLSVIESTFRSRPEAISAAASILAELDAYIAWADDGFEALAGVVETQIDGFHPIGQADALEPLAHQHAQMSGIAAGGG
jgi:hypothetical protein